MKVLKIIHTLGHGGAENTFRWLAWGLRQQGVEVIAAIPSLSDPQKENWIAPALEELGIPYLTFDKAGSPWRLLENISAVIDLVRPDIVHSHLLDSNFYSAIACRRRIVPHVCTEHGDVYLKQTVTSRVKYLLISLCSRSIICVSDAIKKKASSVVPIRSKLKTVYNGIHFFENKPSMFREEFGVPENAVLIGNVGNLYPVKGQKYLIRAFAELLRSYPNAYLTLVGRGEEEKNLRERMRELNLPESQILFTGFRNDIENVLNGLDLYIQPSLSEGHPLAVMEAMSLGVPVIATSVGGVPEVIGQDQYGILVPPGSWEDLYLSIRDYIQTPEVFRKKALVARIYARDNFSIEKMTCNYIGLYQEALKRTGT